MKVWQRKHLKQKAYDPESYSIIYTNRLINYANSASSRLEYLPTRRRFL